LGAGTSYNAPMTTKNRSLFSRFAKYTAHQAGRAAAFYAAVGIIVFWALLGPRFHYGTTWQLIINTGTTIITFLMVFLIQNTQNRDSEAMHVKLDELIRAMEGAHNALLDLEELEEKELDKIRLPYTVLAKRARKELGLGHVDTDRGELGKED